MNIERGEIASFDGTRLAYQLRGAGPPLVYGNGIGVGHESVRLTLEALARRFRVLSWDYRGTFSSGSAGTGGLAITSHARDCLALMDALSIARAPYVGWSMGVQVGLETLRHGDRFSRFAMLAGVAGRPSRAAVPLPLDQLLSRTIRRVLPVASKAVWSRLASDQFVHIARRAGFTHADVDREAFLTMVRGVASHDPRVYLGTLAELLVHDASDRLDALERPVLFMAGGRDRMTPPHVLEALARRAPRGVFHNVVEGSHFALIEHPAEVERVLDAFLREE